jgi:hypothetical protein
MPAWANFFLGELGASATLTGLVFVAVSINLSKIMVSTHLQVTILRRIEPMYRPSFLIMVGLYELAIVLFLVGGVSLLVGQSAGLYWVRRRLGADDRNQPLASF